MTDFAGIGLSDPLLRALDQLGYESPTPVQKESLPVMLRGQDILAQAQTGSGKTAAFGLAMLQGIRTDVTGLQGLVLCPTRELADQVTRELRALGRFIPNLKILSLCGGISIRPQLASLSHIPHLVVGTPGRIQDLLRRKALNLQDVRSVVLDEADRMLDMGFVDAIDQILQQVPTERRTWLFSATYAPEIVQISKQYQREPEEIRIAPEPASRRIQQGFIKAESADKLQAIRCLLGEHQPEACLIFCNTRIDARDVAEQLRQHGYSALALHGDLDQRERDETVVQFANGSCQILVATDVASRGLHIEALPMVIAYELPQAPEVHVHRIGRTGRAGAEGLAFALVSGREQSRLPAIEKILGHAVQWHTLALSKAPPAPRRTKMKTLVIDAGRKDKLRPGDILGALTGVGELQGSQVGKIDIFATRAYVAVEHEHARPVVARLRAATIKRRRFRIRFI